MNRNASQAGEIARSLAGPQLHDTMVAEIVRRADGVPLYVEELTKTIAEAGGVNGDAGELVPATLQTSLVARLDRLGTAKRIAQIGSVIGREFRHDLLETLARESGVRLDGGLEPLIDSGLVTRLGAPPNAVYVFKHALVQDAAYATILRSRRRKLHHLLVERLEATLDKSDRESVDLLAHHALQAELWDRAFAYFKEAGEDANNRSALREAVGQFKQALLASRNLPASPEVFEETIDLLFSLRNALWALGRFEEILTYLDEAERLADGLNDEVRLGWVSVYRGASLWQIGRSDHAKTASRRGREIGEAARDQGLEAAANFYLGCAHVTSGEYANAEGFFERVVEMLPGDLAKERCGLPFAAAIISRSWLVWSYAERGEFVAAERHAKIAADIAEALTHPFNRAHVYYDLGYLQIVRCDFQEAIATLEHALGLIEKWGLVYLSPFTMGFLGHARVLAGEVEAGLKILEEANERYDRINLGLFKSLVGVQLANAYLRAGRIGRASACLDRALQIARTRRERGHEAHGLFILGEIAAQANEVGEKDALQCYGMALERAKELGMAPLAAQCHLGLGRLLQRRTSSEAEAHLTRAREMFEALGLAHP